LLATTEPEAPVDLDARSILLTGRVAVVTGAARGIGAATARLLAACGASVALCDRHGDELDTVVAEIEAGTTVTRDTGSGSAATAEVETGRTVARQAGTGSAVTSEVEAGHAKAGTTVTGQTEARDAVGGHGEAGGAGVVLAATVDVRDAEAVDRFVAAIGERFGRVDVLVNNAGGTFVAPALDVSPKGEAMLLAENFTQVLHLVRRVVPLMDAGGAIVNVTSVEAHQAAPGFAIYAAMKAAVANLTRSLALELAPRGIRVNAMAPDALVSEGEGAAREALAAGGGDYQPATLPPLGHLGAPEDGAAAVLFLASDLARFVTGTTIHVDGGTWAAGGWHRRPPDA
jgi:3-oxoacyl-[acyl-carrier protein] reductase